MMKAATAATESPAICAGVILEGGSTDSAAGAGVVEAEEVAEGKVEMESTRADFVELA